MSVQTSVVSVLIPSGPLFDPKTGNPTFAFIKWMQGVSNSVNQFDTQGNLNPASLPFPTTSSIGGVEAVNPVAHEWVNSIGADGAPTLTQPSFVDISGIANAGQVPPLSQLNGGVTAGQVPPLSQLSGMVTPNQVPDLSTLNGSVTAAQVPSLSALNGNITDAQLPGDLFSGTIVTAKLTTGGANGSMTFLKGSLQSEVPAT
jgi:hypothetical protein